MYEGFLLGRIRVFKEELKALKIQVGGEDNLIQLKRIIEKNKKIKHQAKKLHSIFDVTPIF